ncbi:tripartite tricarboxylate transporter substrate-binding protein [Xanthobacter sp. KR7-225]|uniref:tripartite tricarboxylate transporter substrate-binding protein n=1 Tax=Xanthobacter sp. KR7-225 TaxID=3156613 RepID=UPI0032B4D3D2
MKKFLLGAAAASAAMLMLAAGASAQTFPDRAITMVVPYAAGGPTDTVARLVADAMSRNLGGRIVVENVAGAGGTLGAGRVAKADPNGYTLLLNHIGQATAPTLYPNAPYDSQTAFEPIGLIADVPMTMVSRPDLPPKTLAELIDYARKNKDKITYANAGPGTASHLCGMLFMNLTGLDLTTVPYKGTGPAMIDLIGGQVDFMCDQTTNTTSYIRADKVKVYATTTAARLPTLPQVPSAAESGVPDLSLTIWHGLYAPKGTPAAVVEKLQRALLAALEDPQIKQRFNELGALVVPPGAVTPAALKAKLAAEIVRWHTVLGQGQSARN